MSRLRIFLFRLPRKLRLQDEFFRSAGRRWM